MGKPRGRTERERTSQHSFDSRLTKLVKITEDVRNSLPNKRSLRKKRCRLASNRRQRNSTKPELRSTRKR